MFHPVKLPIRCFISFGYIRPDRILITLYGVPSSCRSRSGYPLVFLAVSWAVTSCSVASAGRPSPAVPAYHSSVTHIAAIPHAATCCGLRVSGYGLFTPAFGIRLTSAVYANGRLSPPFAVYAESTECFQLFILEGEQSFQVLFVLKTPF